MAINTRNRRASAMLPMCPWRGVMPEPDGAVGTSDRATMLLLYSGFTSGGDILGYGRLEYTIPRSQLEWTLADERLEFTARDERLEFTGAIP